MGIEESESMVNIMTTIKIEWSNNVDTTNYPSLEKDLQEATDTALKYVTGSLAILNDDVGKALYARFFGPHDDERQRTVETVLNNVRDQLSNNTMTYVISKARLANTHFFASSFGGEMDGRINIGGGFISAPPTGQDSKYGSIIHEVAHNVNETVSNQNRNRGTDAIEAFAKNQPESAVNCAQNYQYFVEQGAINGTIKPIELKIGDRHAGGIIFSLNPDGVSGTVVTESDLSSGQSWAEAESTCAECELDGYSDWRLGTSDEWHLISTNLFKADIGGLAEAYYWSSTPGYGAGYHRAWDFVPDSEYADRMPIWYDDMQNRVRAVRAF